MTRTGRAAVVVNAMATFFALLAVVAFCSSLAEENSSAIKKRSLLAALGLSATSMGLAISLRYFWRHERDEAVAHMANALALSEAYSTRS
jgi:Na+/proline symporter